MSVKAKSFSQSSRLGSSRGQPDCDQPILVTRRMNCKIASNAIPYIGQVVFAHAPNIADENRAQFVIPVLHLSHRDTR